MVHSSARLIRTCLPVLLQKARSSVTFGGSSPVLASIQRRRPKSSSIPPKQKPTKFARGTPLFRCDRLQECCCGILADFRGCSGTCLKAMQCGCSAGYQTGSALTPERPRGRVRDRNGFDHARQGLPYHHQTRSRWRAKSNAYDARETPSRPLRACTSHFP